MYEHTTQRRWTALAHTTAITQSLAAPCRPRRSPQWHDATQLRLQLRTRAARCCCAGRRLRTSRSFHQRRAAWRQTLSTLTAALQSATSARARPALLMLRRRRRISPQLLALHSSALCRATGPCKAMCRCLAGRRRMIASRSGGAKRPARLHLLQTSLMMMMSTPRRGRRRREQRRCEQACSQRRMRRGQTLPQRTSWPAQLQVGRARRLGQRALPWRLRSGAPRCCGA